MTLRPENQMSKVANKGNFEGSCGYREEPPQQDEDEVELLHYLPHTPPKMILKISHIKLEYLRVPWRDSK